MYILKCFDKWERVMARVVERTSADIADRVVIRALAKLQLQQNEHESLSQENCVQTDGLFDGIRRAIDSNYGAVWKAHEDGAKKIKKIYNVDKRDKRDGKPDQYSLYYVVWWVSKEVDNKTKNIRDTHEALRQIMDREFIQKREKAQLKRGFKSEKYDEQENEERQKKAEADPIYYLWLLSDGNASAYKERFGLTSTLGSKIKNHLNLSHLEDPDRQFSLGSRIELARKKLEKIQNTNDFKKKAMEEWNEAFSNIELLQQYIVQQWKLWYKLLEMVKKEKGQNPTSDRLALLETQEREIETLLNRYLVDRDVEKYKFEKEVTMESPNKPQTSFVTNYCSILINYIPLCYAMGYLDMRKDKNTNPKGRFCVLYSTDEIKNKRINELSEHLGDARIMSKV